MTTSTNRVAIMFHMHMHTAMVCIYICTRACICMCSYNYSTSLFYHIGRLAIASAVACAIHRHDISMHIHKLTYVLLHKSDRAHAAGETRARAPACGSAAGCIHMYTFDRIRARARGQCRGAAKALQYTSLSVSATTLIVPGALSRAKLKPRASKILRGIR